MRNVSGLMNLVYLSTQRLSQTCLDLEASPELRGHRVLGTKIADAALSALTHIASASVDYSGDYRARRSACDSLRGARTSLATLRQLATVGANGHYMDETRAGALITQVNELQTLMIALGVEIRGNGAAA